MYLLKIIFFFYVDISCLPVSGNDSIEWHNNQHIELSTYFVIASYAVLSVIFYTLEQHNCGSLSID